MESKKNSAPHHSLSRRSVLKASAAGVAVGAVAAIVPAEQAHAAGAVTRPARPTHTKGAKPSRPASSYATDVFLHGVASGDPLPNAVILWTRVTPQPTWTPGSGRGTATRVKWEIGPQNGRSRAFTSAVKSGIVTTDPQRDLTVKVDATGLRPDTRYVYRFTVLDGPAAGSVSPVGMTKTAPAPNARNERVRFAFLSCSNWEAGYWSTYRFLADRGDLDFIVHLGDWFYEYARGVYTGAYGLVRPHEWEGETVTLEHYRRRHAENRTDPDLQRCQATYPFLVVWDDHESADNAYLDGAVNHAPATQGPWKVRKAASARAYFEWMPTRVNSLSSGHLYRRFQYGSLMDICLLDLRTYRDKQEYLKIDDPQHSMAGKAQMDWLRRNVVKSPCLWKVIGNPVMMAPLQLPPVSPTIADFIAAKTGAPAHGVVLNKDQWDGYQWDRQNLLDDIVRNNVNNVVAVTGDIHMSFANEIYHKNNGDQNGRRALVEFVGSSISAGNIDDIIYEKSKVSIPEKDPIFAATAQAVRQLNPHIKYLDISRHGYAVTELNRKRAQTDWFYVNDKSNPRTGQYWDKSFATNVGTSRLYEVKKPLAF